MTLLAPLGLLALLALPVLIVFYLLKARYRDQEVGSTYIWERLTRDLAVHEPWQRPRFSLLLLIQALILGGLALGLARPALLSGGEGRAHAVLVLDGSASMNATDVAPSRFERARQLAGEAIARLPDGSTGTVVLAGARPEVLVAETADRSRLLGALERAEPTDAAGDFDAALRMAMALARGRANGQALVFTDGAFSPPPIDPEGVKIVYTAIKGGDDNRAIVALDARAEPQNRRRQQAFVRVQNYADRPVQATVSLRADDRLVEAQTVGLEPLGAAAAVFNDLPTDARVLEARLVEPDALASDDRAWAILERREPTQVLLVTSGNVFLERALTLLPDGELFRVSPRRFGAIDASIYDLIVFDGQLPDIPPPRPLLIVNPQDSPFLPASGVVRRPGPLGWSADEPLLRYVDLRDVRISRLTQLQPPGWARTLVDAASIDGGAAVPAILAGEVDGRRVVVFAFDLQASNLPLSSAFPILVANVIGYLEPPRVLDRTVAKPGALLNVRAQTGADELVVEGESGTTIRQRLEGRVLSIDAPLRVGPYVVRQLADGRPLAVEPLAVSLADAVESDLRSRTIALPSGTASATAPASGYPLPGSRDVWTIAIGAALGLLGLEWWWFHRRA